VTFIYRKERGFMADVKRKKNETFDALLRRFQRRFQDSGRSIETRRRRFRSKDQNLTKRRASALRREEMRGQYEYLAKTGQLKEDPKKQRNTRRAA
jgi:ribosomal protein S21